MSKGLRLVTGRTRVRPNEKTNANGKRPRPEPVRVTEPKSITCSEEKLLASVLMVPDATLRIRAEDRQAHPGAYLKRCKSDPDYAYLSLGTSSLGSYYITRNRERYVFVTPDPWTNGLSKTTAFKLIPYYLKHRTLEQICLKRGLLGYLKEGEYQRLLADTHWNLRIAMVRP